MEILNIAFTYHFYKITSLSRTREINYSLGTFNYNSFARNKNNRRKKLSVYFACENIDSQSNVQIFFLLHQCQILIFF